MANIYHNGFRWVQNKSAPGAPPPIVTVPVADAYAVKIPRGYPVKILSTGYAEVAASNDPVFGIMDGAEQYFDSGAGAMRGGIALPASISYGTNFGRQSRIRVIPVRNQLFQIPVDENTTATTLDGYQAFVQENVDWAAGTTVGDEAGCQLDISTHATTAEDCRIEMVPNRESQDFTSTGVALLVSFNLIQDTASGSTTGT